MTEQVKEDRKPYLVVITRNEPAEAYLLKNTTAEEASAMLYDKCDLHYKRRGQLFSLATGGSVTDIAFQNIPGLIKLKGLADVWLQGDRSAVLQRYINMTEEMETAAALPELQHAVELLQHEIEKCQQEQESTGQ